MSTTETSTPSKTPSPISMSQTNKPTGRVEPLMPVTGRLVWFIFSISSRLKSETGRSVPVEPQSQSPLIGIEREKISDFICSFDHNPSVHGNARAALEICAREGLTTGGVHGFPVVNENPLPIE